MIDFSKFKNSGDLFLPKDLQNFLNIYLIGSNKSLFYLNIWSILHFISGIITASFFNYYTKYSFLKSIILAFIIHTIWEYWQYIITNTSRTLRGLIDTFVDTILFLLGFIIVY